MSMCVLVCQYSYRFDYKLKDVDRSSLGEIPSQFTDLTSMLAAKEIIDPAEIPNQITINEYEPGQGIGHHVDTHSRFVDTSITHNC